MTRLNESNTIFEKLKLSLLFVHVCFCLFVYKEKKMNKFVDSFASQALASAFSAITASVVTYNKELLESFFSQFLGRNPTIEAKTETSNDAQPTASTQPKTSATTSAHDNCSSSTYIIVIILLIVIIIVLFFTKSKKKTETITVTIEGARSETFVANSNVS